MDTPKRTVKADCVEVCGDIWEDHWSKHSCTRPSGHEGFHENGNPNPLEAVMWPVTHVAPTGKSKGHYDEQKLTISVTIPLDVIRNAINEETGRAELRWNEVGP
jgi:hypothetical protein